MTTQPDDELLPDRIWVGNENKDLRFRHDSETEKYLGPATEYQRPTPHMDDQVDDEALKRDIAIQFYGHDEERWSLPAIDREIINYITAHYNLTRKGE